MFLFLIPTTQLMVVLIIFEGTNLRPFLETRTIIPINLIIGT